jgi:hypothetical protein
MVCLRNPQDVVILPIPASVWRQIQFLPYIMHRFSRALLLAEFATTLKAELSFGQFPSTKSKVDFDKMVILLRFYFKRKETIDRS